MTRTPTPRSPRCGDRLEVTIERLDERGDGVGPARSLAEEVAAGDLSVAVRASAPGERLAVELLRRRRGRAEARRIERLDPGPHAVPARCPHFGTCGGCAFQTVAYPLQLVELRRLAQEALARAELPVEVEPVVGMDDPWHYRNKMDFTFGSRRWIEPHEPPGAPADFALGLHVGGRHDKVLDLERCAIHFRGADELVASARELARAQGLAPWDLRAQRGLLRHLVLRRGMRTGELLVDLVTSCDLPEAIEPYAAAFLARHPEVTTFVQNVNTRAATVAVGERERVLHGEGTIREVVGGLTFALSANSFFQTNTEQAERLFEIVAEEAEVGEGERVFDLYCGTGAIALSLARRGARVVGFESVPSAVRDARANAAANGLAATEFIEGDVLEALGASAGGAAPGVVVVDPPRAGLHPRVVPLVAALGARRIVYVSCNVASAARDLPRLLSEGYALERARPVDLFPHTPHLEIVFRLSRLARA